MPRTPLVPVPMHVHINLRLMIQVCDYRAASRPRWEMFEESFAEAGAFRESFAWSGNWFGRYRVLTFVRSVHDSHLASLDSDARVYY
jgi:hypothetical protein